MPREIPHRLGGLVDAQEAAGWEAALEQADRTGSEAAPNTGSLPDAGMPAAEEPAAALSSASAAALAALRLAEAEATRAAILKARFRCAIMLSRFIAVGEVSLSAWAIGVGCHMVRSKVASLTQCMLSMLYNRQPHAWSLRNAGYQRPFVLAYTYLMMPLCWKWCCRSMVCLSVSTDELQAEGLVAMVGWVEQLVDAAERHISVMQVAPLPAMPPFCPVTVSIAGTDAVLWPPQPLAIPRRPFS